MVILVLIKPVITREKVDNIVNNNLPLAQYNTYN